MPSLAFGVLVSMFSSWPHWLPSDAVFLSVVEEENEFIIPFFLIFHLPQILISTQILV